MTRTTDPHFELTDLARWQLLGGKATPPPADPFDVLAVECGNCAWTGTGAEIETTLHMIHHLADRLDPGGTVPAGECPECGALCYPVT